MIDLENSICEKIHACIKENFETKIINPDYEFEKKITLLEKVAIFSESFKKISVFHKDGIENLKQFLKNKRETIEINLKKILDIYQ